MNKKKMERINRFYRSGGSSCVGASVSTPCIRPFPPSVHQQKCYPSFCSEVPPAGQPLTPALTPEIARVKYRLVETARVWVHVCGREKRRAGQNQTLAKLKGKVLIDLDSPRCVVHLEYQNSQYCKPLTLTYVILLAYRQTILSPRGRQAGQNWPQLTTSLLLHLDFICVIVGQHLGALSRGLRSPGSVWMDIPQLEDTADDMTDLSELS